MKKINRELKTYETIFVSVDGKEFKTEADCREWEKSYKGTMAASWANIKKVEVNAMDLCLPYGSEDFECYMLTPRSLEEITYINAYVSSITCSNSPVLNTNHIGVTVVLNFGFDHDWCEVYQMDRHLADIAEYVAKKEKELKEC